MKNFAIFTVGISALFCADSASSDMLRPMQMDSYIPVRLTCPVGLNGQMTFYYESRIEHFYLMDITIYYKRGIPVEVWREEEQPPLGFASGRHVILSTAKDARSLAFAKRVLSMAEPVLRDICGGEGKQRDEYLRALANNKISVDQLANRWKW